MADFERPKHYMAFLLIAPGNCWGGNDIQADHGVGTPTPSMPLFLGWGGEELTLLTDIGNNWTYAFVQLHEGALHVSLSKGHISTMIDGVSSRSTCRHLHQLEVHKLLQCKDQVACPKGLNEGLEPVLFSLPKLPIWDKDILGRPVCEPLLLQVDLSHALLGDQMPIIPGPCRTNTNFLSMFSHEVSQWNS